MRKGAGMGPRLFSGRGFGSLVLCGSEEDNGSIPRVLLQYIYYSSLICTLATGITCCGNFVSSIFFAAGCILPGREQL